MSDSYQAIYDAVRSRISGGNIGDAVRDAASRAFDISHLTARLYEEFGISAREMQRPSVLWRPTVAPDGTKWCALYGPNIAEGVCGFGDTPAEAMEAFDQAWWKEHTPTARRGRDKPEGCRDWACPTSDAEGWSA